MTTQALSIDVARASTKPGLITRSHQLPPNTHLQYNDANERLEQARTIRGLIGTPRARKIGARPAPAGARPAPAGQIAVPYRRRGRPVWPGRGEGANTTLRHAALLRDVLTKVTAKGAPLLEAVARYEEEMLPYVFGAVANSLNHPFKPVSTVTAPSEKGPFGA
jgi:hypothetical protein